MAETMRASSDALVEIPCLQNCAYTYAVGFLIAISKIIAEAGTIANKSFINKDLLAKLLSFGLEVVYIGPK
ncbi:MAG: hypothetical protein CMA84_04805 [Euryarchaeota archaeon]|nr:hypothetical protein [Euryarchaeota archaeon]|tara:strand:- start:388 stop:600 length:213 start_codon:yes stop_codon:yes gene_type:complete